MITPKNLLKYPIVYDMHAGGKQHHLVDDKTHKPNSNSVASRLSCLCRIHDVGTSWSNNNNNNRFNVQMLPMLPIRCMLVCGAVCDAVCVCVWLYVWLSVCWPILHKIHFYYASYTCIAVLGSRAHVMYCIADAETLHDACWQPEHEKALRLYGNSIVFGLQRTLFAYMHFGYTRSVPYIVEHHVIVESRFTYDYMP